ncbi:MAG: FG-GAP-like repeat-containing protein [Deltaproteobacteria bacterium]|nr:FG-GAP-like repeat-containing protein [Deltaproteobacteria bacterium]
MRRTAIAIALLAVAGAAPAQMQVTATTPIGNGSAAANASIAVTFDRAVNPATLTASTFRIFGRVTGTKSGSFVLSNANKTVTITPSEAFAAGEVVWVNLSHGIVGADATALRSAGYFFSFTIDTQPASLNFELVDTVSNLGSSPQTRIYGAMAADLNNDQYADLTTVNEVSADLRVLMNRADGSGKVFPFLQPPLAVGVESSPNEPGDFDNDGRIDIAVSSTAENGLWIARGNGDGTFATPQQVPTCGEAHGVAVLDVDGDADPDVVDACRGGNQLALTLNNGSGVFGAATLFDGGVDGEYGLLAGDVNNDGIADLVVAGNDGHQLRALLGNGNGTFSPAAAQSTGGATWVVVSGDINGDGKLDVAAANSFDGTIGVLQGNGDGTFDPPTLIPIGFHVPSVDLGDLDGNGTIDMVVSSYWGQFWRVFTNDGSGSFNFHQEIEAVANPSCSILVDLDNDGDLDLALTDEIADVVKLMLNAPLPVLPCPPAPSATCRAPLASGKSKLKLKDESNDAHDKLIWKWTKGAATAKPDFGSPLTTDHYALCIYDGGTLVGSSIAEAGAEWEDQPAGYKQKDKTASPYGALKVQLRAGSAGQAKIGYIGRGTSLSMPNVSALSGPIDVQLIHAADATCWGATFSAPFKQNDGVTFKDVSD